MIRRAILSSSIALLLSSGFAVVSAHDIPGAHFNADCDTGEEGSPINHGYSWDRPISVLGADLVAVGGKITVQNTNDFAPCYDGHQDGNGPQDDYISMSAYWAADMQGYGSNGVWQFVQLGIGKVDLASGYYQCSGSQTMSNAYINFVFTPGNSSGDWCRASWVDFNNNGTPDNPTIGHTYKFSIEEHECGGSLGNCWEFCVEDINLVVTDCGYIGRDSSDGGLRPGIKYAAGWWGCETGNNANAVGTITSTNPAILKETWYSKDTAPGTKIYTEDSAVNYAWQGYVLGYHKTQSQDGLGEQVYCYTNSHGS
jgi:hypothetical protein